MPLNLDPGQDVSESHLTSEDQITGVSPELLFIEVCRMSHYISERNNSCSVHAKSFELFFIVMFSGNILLGVIILEVASVVPLEVNRVCT